MIQNNQFTGTIPESFSQWKKMITM